jgi:serine/threonine-protein phosphatase 2A regulatory subunit B
MAGLGKRSPGDGPDIGSDFSSKLLHLAWHPEANVIACAASNSLYMYCA